jgi:phage gp29-like protein
MPENTKKKATPKDMQELSFVGDSRLTAPFIGLNRFGFFHSFNPDTLVTRKGMRIYDRMLLDDQIKAIQSMKKNAVLQPGWEIVPASDDPLDREIAENVEWNFHIMQGTLDDRLREIMSSNDYGFSVSELVWHVIDHGTFEGKIGLKDIKSRRPHSWLFHIDEHGNLLGMKQHFLINQTQEQLPPDKFIIDVNDKKFGNMYGESELRAAYRSFWAKENLMLWWNIYGERHAIPLAMGKYGLDNQITSPDHQEELKKIINVIQSKMSTLLPPGTDIEFKDVAKGGERFFVASISFHDMAMAKALLMPQLLGMSTQTRQGSFAQAKTQFSLFLLTLEKMQKQLEETVMLEQVIKRLVDFNYVVDEYPKFQFLPTTKEDKLETAKTWVEALRGQAVVSGIDDENKVRELLDFDEREETEEEKERRLNPQPVPTVIKPPEEEEDPTKELSIESFRLPNEVEGKMDFVRIEKNLDKVEQKFIELLVGTFTKQKGKLLDLVKRKVDKGTLDMRFINKELNLKFKQDIIRTLKEFMRSGYGLGQEDAGREAGGTQFAIDPVLPEAAIKFLEDKSFWVSGLMNDDILNDVRSVLVEGLKTGASFKEMSESIDDVYKPFIGDPTAIEGTGITSPFRVETVIRTNLSDAYNQGRLAMGADPALEDFIVGWEYSEILDSRTVPISIFADGKKIKKDDPDLPSLSYPLHFNERGLFVPVTTDDLPVKWITPSQKSRLKNMMGKFR